MNVHLENAIKQLRLETLQEIETYKNEIGRYQQAVQDLENALNTHAVLRRQTCWMRILADAGYALPEYLRNEQLVVSIPIWLSMERIFNIANRAAVPAIKKFRERGWTAEYFFDCCDALENAWALKPARDKRSNFVSDEFAIEFFEKL